MRGVSMSRIYSERERVLKFNNRYAILEDPGDIEGAQTVNFIQPSATSVSGNILHCHKRAERP
jgi:hypothetical protein